MKYTYAVIERKPWGTTVRHDYPCDDRNDKRSWPRILSMWKGKAEAIYKVYANSVCDRMEV